MVSVGKKAADEDVADPRVGVKLQGEGLVAAGDYGEGKSVLLAGLVVEDAVRGGAAVDGAGHEEIDQDAGGEGGHYDEEQCPGVGVLQEVLVGGGGVQDAPNLLVPGLVAVVESDMGFGWTSWGVVGAGREVL